MFDKFVAALESKEYKESILRIQEFIASHCNASSIPELNNDHLRERLWSGLFAFVNKPDATDLDRLYCVTTLKILIRDKTDLDTLATKERLESMMKCAHLHPKCMSFPQADDTCKVLESLKCLYNIIINFNLAAEKLYHCNIMGPLINRVVNFKDPHQFDVRVFDLKLLFLLTAFHKCTRIKLLETAGGLSFFNGVLESQLNIINNKSPNIEPKMKQQQLLLDELKILFNVLLELKGGELGHFCKAEELNKFVAVLREYLVANVEISGISLNSDVINLLTLIPVEHLSAITTELMGNVSKTKDEVKEAGFTAVTVIMDYLEKVLTDFEEGKDASGVKSKNPNARELLPPVLLVLLHLAQSGTVIRRHIRKRILPKLTEAEVFTRPEEGKTLRNKLCRLLTSPTTNITDATADLLFILCKESVGRMVKYTGYGNAAGLFARRGLMSRPLGYSSDSEGSDTEEYKKHKEFINPIVGCRTPAHPDPLEGMTEEQKEVLAMELVNKVDKLLRDKLIQPCVVGPDGRPQPIEHVQQLQMFNRNDGNNAN